MTTSTPIWTPGPMQPLALGIDGVENLWQVKPGVYRSAQPDTKANPRVWWHLAKALKLTTVVCLRTDGETNQDFSTRWSAAAEAADVGAVPLNLTHIAMDPLLPPDILRLDDAVNAVDKLATIRDGLPAVIVHCSRGRDRTGLVTMCLMMRYGMSFAAAAREFWRAQHPDPITAEWWMLLRAAEEYGLHARGTGRCA